MRRSAAQQRLRQRATYASLAVADDPDRREARGLDRHRLGRAVVEPCRLRWSTSPPRWSISSRSGTPPCRPTASTASATARPSRWPRSANRRFSSAAPFLLVEAVRRHVRAGAGRQSPGGIASWSSRSSSTSARRLPALRRAAHAARSRSAPTNCTIAAISSLTSASSRRWRWTAVLRCRCSTRCSAPASGSGSSTARSKSHGYH